MATESPVVVANHVISVNVANLVPLKDGDIIQTGDIVMDDFARPHFAVGNCHERAGTPYHEFADMPIMRSNPPLVLQE